MVHKMLNCDPTSLNKPERPTTYMYNVSAGKSAVVEHVKRRLSCVWRISTSWIIQNQIGMSGLNPPSMLLGVSMLTISC